MTDRRFSSALIPARAAMSGVTVTPALAPSAELPARPANRRPAATQMTEIRLIGITAAGRQ